MMVYKLPLTQIHLFNIIAQIAFNILLVRYAGVKALAYLIMSSFLAGSLHPCAGHFIAEHYVFEQKSRIAKDSGNLVPVPETFSYYGPLNMLTYNVGLHNEHHDFPLFLGRDCRCCMRLQRTFTQTCHIIRAGLGSFGSSSGIRRWVYGVG